MRLPWTDRVEAAERRVVDAEESALRAGEYAEQVAQQAAERTAYLQTELVFVRAENKILIDRIVQLSGQPPIFHPEPKSAMAEPQPQTISALPGPETRVSFADVHRAAKAAIKSGELNLLTRTN